MKNGSVRHRSHDLSEKARIAAPVRTGRGDKAPYPDRKRETGGDQRFPAADFAAAARLPPDAAGEEAEAEDTVQNFV